MYLASRPLLRTASVLWLAIAHPSTDRSQGAHFQQLDVSSAGVQGNGFCGTLHVSGNGNVVAFNSSANNLVPGDTNGAPDGFVRDLSLGTIERPCVGVLGQQAAGETAIRGLSHDGRFVVFISAATNLHPLDSDAWADVYVRDRVAGTTELISVLMDSTPSIYHCLRASISADGRYVAFDGLDPNFVPGDTNAAGDVFVRDRLLGTTTLASVSNSGEIGNFSSFTPSISADGRRVAFLSYATNFHPSPTGNNLHVYLRDLDAGTTTALDVNPWGRLGNNGVMAECTISADGSTVAFVSFASDLAAGMPTGGGAKPVVWREGEPLSIVMFPWGTPGAGADRLELSQDGRYLAFRGENVNWVPGDPTSDWDIFLHDTHLNVTNEVSSKSYAEPANHASLRCSISDDGRVIGFVSQATNLVPGTLPGIHAFVRILDPTPGLIHCAASPNLPGCKPLLSVSGTPSASAGGGHGIDVAGTLNAQPGLFVYSTAGAAIQPFGPPWLCVGPPLRRIAAQSTGGAPPPTFDCSGSLALDFNAWIATGADAALVPGAGVWLQGWTRDPTSAFGSLLSEAVAFQVGL